MQYKMFSVPTDDGHEEAEELNRFLRGHRIVSVEKVFQDGNTPRWHFLVEYLAGTPEGDRPRRSSRRIDYKEMLSEEDFAVFSRLRERRKELAQAEAIPVYAVCTNEQLAAIVQNGCRTLESLRSIDGLGSTKIKRYGEKLLSALEPVRSS